MFFFWSPPKSPLWSLLDYRDRANPSSPLPFLDGLFPFAFLSPKWWFVPRLSTSRKAGIVGVVVVVGRTADGGGQNVERMDYFSVDDDAKASHAGVPSRGTSRKVDWRHDGETLLG